MASELVLSHFAGARASGLLGRVEFLPISWHDALHGAANNLDEGLRLITLPSTPLLREFTNDTIVDVLYYTSPIFSQVGGASGRLLAYLLCHTFRLPCSASETDTHSLGREQQQSSEDDRIL